MERSQNLANIFGEIDVPESRYSFFGCQTKLKLAAAGKWNAARN